MTKSINIRYDENCDYCKIFYIVNGGHYMNNCCPIHVKKFRCANCYKGYNCYSKYYIFLIISIQI